MFKTNFDGAVFEDLGAVGIGAMVRSSFSEVLAALPDIIVLETIAAKRAILFVRELGFSGSILEGDSEKATLAIKK